MRPPETHPAAPGAAKARPTGQRFCCTLRHGDTIATLGSPERLANILLRTTTRIARRAILTIAAQERL